MIKNVALRFHGFASLESILIYRQISMLNQYLPWFQNIPWGNLLPWLLTFSLVAFLFSVFGVSIVLLRLPVDFLSNPAPSKSSKGQLKWLISKLGRNVLGAIFLIVGTIMLLTPGQGILSIVVGLMLLDFPGKQNLIRKILTKQTIFRTINRMRATAKHPPLHPPVVEQAQERS
jgi:UPF0716 family protein affecting phage T7 exclusion